MVLISHVGEYLRYKEEMAFCMWETPNLHQIFLKNDFYCALNTTFLAQINHIPPLRNTLFHVCIK